jgi:DNA-binding transcriptional MerR regulator
MADYHAKYERKHEEAIGALLVTTTLGAAAKKAGIGERTLRRWLTQPHFQAEYRRARREVVQGAIHVLLQSAGTATRTLVSIMDDPEQPATARVSAARCILQMVMHALKDDDLEARFAEIEQRLAEQERRGVYGHRPPAA